MPSRSRNGRCVAAEEERDEERARRDELHVLAGHEHAELHPGVLDEVAGDDLALALGLVERDALRLGRERREEQDERERLDEDPHACSACHCDHVAEPDAAVDDEEPDER